MDQDVKDEVPTAAGEENGEEKDGEEEEEELTHNADTGAKYYTMEEIGPHSTVGSLWIVVDNLVYDITNFTLEHPGGEEILFEQGGQDASTPFEDVGHSSDAREMMRQYLIGEVHPRDQKRKKKQKGGSKWGSSGSGSSAGDSSERSWLNQFFVGLGLALMGVAAYKTLY
ncbi:cytochrome b5-like [Symsagittifera roscoffensis]|uniref:cytochrome b5-like n=1 Tax=Symsagittifera roscoffensis TaxID=84072 RepID=UPI00307BD138